MSVVPHPVQQQVSSLCRVAGVRRIAIAMLAVVAIALLVYWPGLGGGFLFDDYPNIVNNKAIQIDRLDAESLLGAAGAYKGIAGRPIATTSFALDYYLHGTDPRGYKLSSILVHAINAALVLLLAWSLLRLPRARISSPLPVAFAVAVAWAIHPLQTSTVLYIVQRMEMLALTFSVIALLCYVRGRRLQIEGHRGWPWIALTVPAGVLALLAKESAALLPLYAFALELTVLRFDAAHARTSKVWKLLYAAGGIAVLVAFVALLPAHFDPALYRHRDFTVGQRLLTQLRVLPMYLGQIVLPLPGWLQFYYDDLQASRSLFSPLTTALGAALLAALAALAWWLRGRWPLFSLGILWFFAAHALTSNVIPLELAFEHRNYFALLGIALAAADLISRIPTADGPAIKRFAVGVVLMVLAGLGAIRAATWGEPLLLAVQMTSVNPTSARASVDLASRYAGLSGNDRRSPMYSLAIKEFERGAELPGASPLSEQGLILLAALSGAPQSSKWWDSLNEKLQRRPVGAQERSAITSLMKRRYEGVPVDDAQLSRTYSLFVERSGSPSDLCIQYADFAYTYLRDDDLAQRMYLRALDRYGQDESRKAALFARLLSEGRMRHADAILLRMGKPPSAGAGDAGRSPSPGGGEDAGAAAIRE